MGKSLECVALKGRLGDLVYPLIRAYDPACTLDAWRQQVGRFGEEQKGGIVALRDTFARGLLLYQVVEGPLKSLCVTALIAPDLLFGDEITQALLKAAAASAKAMGCQDLQVPEMAGFNHSSHV